MAEKVPWWKSAVVYQIYPRSFLDTDGDGVGNLAGITAKLDYLNDGTEQSLGIDAIWLNPFYPSPQFDFGYDVMDYRAVDPQYGTMEDFDRLLAEAHRRNIRIVMDIVPTLTSHLHPWFIESRSSKTNPKRDWYLWHPGRGRRRYPNNWMGAFGKRPWDWDNKTKEFYYHNSLPEQPDLNWRNPEVQKAILDAMAFWFDKGVDGFRIDVLNLTIKDDLFRDNPYCIGRRPYDMQRHLYDKDRPEAVEVGKLMRRLADSYGGRMLVGETYIFDPEEAARYLGDGDGVNMAFNFSFMNSRFSAARFRNEVEAWERAVGNRGWPAYFLSNHDNDRHISRYGRGKWTIPRARLAAAMLLTLRGTPYLYMGEEIGMENGRLRRHELLDPVGRRYFPLHHGRDGARTPMQWTAGPNGGFSSGDPWLRVNPSYPTTNVAMQEDDPDSLLTWYKRLIHTRKAHPALSVGSYSPVGGTGRGVFAFHRQDHGQKLLVLLNFSRWRKSLSAAEGSKEWGKKVLAYPDSYGSSVPLAHIDLAPYGILILEE
jgi:alpha-glucosidase